ncbi:flagellar protein FlaG protein [Thermaerobacter marianensis DSM 12885]|uniref:Flagellar protein FlaG protein n=1 Tax=Thermaerobacter marianensis (strain ATCC 700841 / DSM 12885 / JCM 10246 / 7p75a) TaxID=644966 RepID=E6SLP2_THEM7|nr:flagellar protein FlaG protein [Thermaerobacter marianensis DSM 12885]
MRTLTIPPQNPVAGGGFTAAGAGFAATNRTSSGRQVRDAGAMGGTGAAGTVPGSAPAAAPAGSDTRTGPLQDLAPDPFGYRLQFHVDDATGRVVAQVVDRETGEIVRQVPPEYVLRIAMYIEALLGQWLDRRG